MPNIVVVGTQWGDEGKGKVVDVLSPRVDAVVRFQGGNNAGHTLVVDDDVLIVHLMPSGILHPGCTCVIGNGVVVDPAVLVDEIRELEERGHSIGVDKLLISSHAHVIMPYHRALDHAREAALGKRKIGTTGRGIGPCYEDKAARRGVVMAHLLDQAALKEQIERVIGEKNRMLVEWFGQPELDVGAIVEEYMGYAERLAPHVGDAVGFLHRIGDGGGSVLFEGAQGTFLDVDHGTYPFVTSSNTVAGAACAGSGVGPTAIDEVVGIVKAYTTRVGTGPFPTEDHGEAGEQLRANGGEFGATTGRPRRCGWFDAVLVRHAARVNGLTCLALTKLDVLSGLEKIPVCVGYEGFDEFPGTLDDVEPIYEWLPGWDASLDNCRTLDELPPTARSYLERIEELTGVPVQLVSVGPGRDQTITRGELFAR